MNHPEYPFSAVVGQDHFKQALLLNATDPRIGGVLISGPRGMAKSTLARALAGVLPDTEAAFVTLPLGASEEHLLGSLDMQHILNQGEVSFRPGLLARAHGGVLYVDEVNLLADVLVDQLLDVCASGINRVERDGISHSHAARFMLIGTMNPDEGELRPQLQDRFGLMVSLDQAPAVSERIEIVRRREQFDEDAQGFCQHWQGQQQLLRERLARARQGLAQIRCPDAIREDIARRCAGAHVEGLRADVVWFRAARAQAALDGAEEVSPLHVQAVAELVLTHRRQDPPAQTPPSAPPPSGSSYRRPPDCRPPDYRPPDTRQPEEPGSGQDNQGDWGQMPAESLRWQEETLKALTPATTGNDGEAPRKRNRDGRMNSDTCRIHWPATLRQSLPQWPPRMLQLQPQPGQMPRIHWVLLDTSGSTLSAGMQQQARNIVQAIGRQAYLAREQLAVWVFGNGDCQQLLHCQRAPKSLSHILRDLPAGGGTPLRQGLQASARALSRLLRQRPGQPVQSYVLTDGRSRQSLSGLGWPGACALVDIEQGAVRRSRGPQLAQELGAAYFTWEQFCL